MSQKTWFITGCSTGFGRVFVEELLKTDARVVATARNVDSIADFNKTSSEQILTLPLDVTKPEQITNAVSAATARFGSIDVLVNNAGYGILGALEETSLSSVKKIFDTNVIGLIAMTQAVLPVMRKQRSGHIFNISSVVGIVAPPGISMYSATKFAVESLSEALAGEVAPLGIKVTIIEPGPFRTDFAGRSLELADKLPDYEHMVASRERVLKMDGTQEGDPIKAAKAMIDISTMDTPPLRILMGASAVDRARAKLTTQLDEIEQYEQLSRSLDY